MHHACIGKCPPGTEDSNHFALSYFDDKVIVEGYKVFMLVEEIAARYTSQVILVNMQKLTSSRLGQFTSPKQLAY